VVITDDGISADAVRWLKAHDIDVRIVKADQAVAA
jgi:hypothetical protein